MLLLTTTWGQKNEINLSSSLFCHFLRWHLFPNMVFHNVALSLVCTHPVTSDNLCTQGPIIGCDSWFWTLFFCILLLFLCLSLSNSKFSSLYFMRNAEFLMFTVFYTSGIVSTYFFLPTAKEHFSPWTGLSCANRGLWLGLQWYYRWSEKHHLKWQW